MAGHLVVPPSGRVRPTIPAMRTVALALAAVALAAGLAIAVLRSSAGSSPAVPVAHAARASTPPLISVSSTPTGRTIPAGFVGLSFEYWALENYAGQNPNAIDPVLVRLIHNLVPSGPASIRIGGVTSDRTWWPVPGLPRPPGVYYTLTPTRLEVARALAVATHARLILGVQFEADSTAEAAGESHAMMHIIGGRRIDGLELGNEPELYAVRWFYKVNGADVFGRPSSWGFGPFVRDYGTIARAMGGAPLAGPAIGAYSWMVNLGQFLSAVPVSIVTLHRYPLQSCGPRPGDPNYPTIGHLLSAGTTVGLADAFAPFVDQVHAHGLLVRNAEMNSVSCGDAHGVANTFASALWSLDALFAMARIGVDGVNLHTYSGAADQLFSVTHPRGRWHAFVAPEYYGVWMFSQAAPPGSQLLATRHTRIPPTLRVWATRTTAGQVHVVLINAAVHHAQRVTLRIPGAPPAATLVRLQAPHVRSLSGVELGGRTFGADTTTGVPRGALRRIALTPLAGAYSVRLPAASAAMITAG